VVSVDSESPTVVSLPLRVLGDRVLIKPDIEERAVAQTDSGIFVAETLEAAVTGQEALPSYVSGTVVAIGNQDQPFDVRPYVLRRLKAKSGMVRLLHLIKEIEDLPAHKPCDFAVGDRVTFSWKAGQDVTINDEAFVILKESEVLAVLQETA
jgi:co-chaperonin GroES (HSP10)